MSAHSVTGGVMDENGIRCIAVSCCNLSLGRWFLGWQNGGMDVTCIRCRRSTIIETFCDGSWRVDFIVDPGLDARRAAESREWEDVGQSTDDDQWIHCRSSREFCQAVSIILSQCIDHSLSDRGSWTNAYCESYTKRKNISYHCFCELWGSACPDRQSTHHLRAIYTSSTHIYTPYTHHIHFIYTPSTHHLRPIFTPSTHHYIYT